MTDGPSEDAGLEIEESCDSGLVVIYLADVGLFQGLPALWVWASKNLGP